MQATTEKSVRGVQHQYQNTVKCEILPTDCIGPKAEVPLTPNCDHDGNQDAIPDEKSQKSPLYRDTADQRDIQLARHKDSKLMSRLYGDTNDENESPRQGRKIYTGDKSQEKPKTMSQLYEDKTDHRESPRQARRQSENDTDQEQNTAVSKLYKHEDKTEAQPAGSQDDEDKLEPNVVLYTAPREYAYETCQPTMPPEQYSSEHRDEADNTGQSTSEQAKVVALFGTGACFAAYFTAISGTKADTHPGTTAYTTSPAAEPPLTTSISPPSEVTTVPFDVTAALPDVKADLKEAATAQPEMTTVLPDTTTTLSVMTARPVKDITMRLSCPAGQTLVIDDANFGRTSKDVCRCRHCKYTNCRAASSLSIVWSACQGSQHCTLTAKYRVFGDPCRGFAKYLQVKYRCFTACGKPFGMISGAIPDGSICASSYLGPGHQPYRGRLNGVAGAGAWTAKTNTIGQWLQVDLGETERVTGTIVQGSHYGNAHWVTSYKLQHSADGTIWTPYADSDGSDKVFAGNTDRNTHVTNVLDYPIDARYVRFVVQSWHYKISMRTEILGCSTKVGACQPNPCANGGTCLDRVDGPVCVCCPPFQGKNCSIVCHTPMRTDSNGRYRWDLPRLTGSRFMFEVEAKSDVRVALSSKKEVATYQVIIGGSDNTESVIRRSRQDNNHVTVSTPGIVSPTEYRTFWITWSSDGTIAVGRSGEGQPFMEWRDPDPLPIVYAGFSTGSRNSDQWNLCHTVPPEEAELECLLGAVRRKDCGWGGVTPDQCRQKGCCFDDSTCIFSNNVCELSALKTGPFLSSVHKACLTRSPTTPADQLSISREGPWDFLVKNSPSFAPKGTDLAEVHEIFELMSETEEERSYFMTQHCLPGQTKSTSTKEVTVKSATSAKMSTPSASTPVTVKSATPAKMSTPSASTPVTVKSATPAKMSTPSASTPVTVKSATPAKMSTPSASTPFKVVTVKSATPAKMSTPSASTPVTVKSATPAKMSTPSASTPVTVKSATPAKMSTPSASTPVTVKSATPAKMSTPSPSTPVTVKSATPAKMSTPSASTPVTVKSATPAKMSTPSASTPVTVKSATPAKMSTPSASTPVTVKSATPAKMSTPSASTPFKVVTVKSATSAKMSTPSASTPVTVKSATPAKMSTPSASTPVTVKSATPAKMSTPSASTPVTVKSATPAKMSTPSASTPVTVKSATPAKMSTPSASTPFKVVTVKSATPVKVFTLKTVQPYALQKSTMPTKVDTSPFTTPGREKMQHLRGEEVKPPGSTVKTGSSTDIRVCYPYQRGECQATVDKSRAHSSKSGKLYHYCQPCAKFRPYLGHQLHPASMCKLEEACSHIAVLLFTIEASTSLQENGPASISKKAVWNKYYKEKISEEMDFSHPVHGVQSKRKLKQRHDVPALAGHEAAAAFAELRRICPTAGANLKKDDDTDTVSEGEADVNTEALPPVTYRWSPSSDVDQHRQCDPLIPPQRQELLITHRQWYHTPQHWQCDPLIPPQRQELLITHRQWYLTPQHWQCDPLIPPQRQELLITHRQWYLTPQHRQCDPLIPPQRQELLITHRQWYLTPQHRQCDPLIPPQRQELLITHRQWYLTPQHWQCDPLIPPQRQELLITHRQWYLTPQHWQCDPLIPPQRQELLITHRHWYLTPQHRQCDPLIPPQRQELLITHRQWYLTPQHRQCDPLIPPQHQELLITHRQWYLLTPQHRQCDPLIPLQRQEQPDHSDFSNSYMMSTASLLNIDTCDCEFCPVVSRVDIRENYLLSLAAWRRGEVTVEGLPEGFFSDKKRKPGEMGSKKLQVILDCREEISVERYDMPNRDKKKRQNRGKTTCLVGVAGVAKKNAAAAAESASNLTKMTINLQAAVVVAETANATAAKATEQATGQPPTGKGDRRGGGREGRANRGGSQRSGRRGPHGTGVAAPGRQGGGAGDAQRVECTSAPQATQDRPAQLCDPVGGENILGSGGFGRVFLKTFADCGIGLVAVKQLARRTKATTLSLLQEADILAKVCQKQWFPFIYGINPDVPQPYLVQEFVYCTEGSMISVGLHYRYLLNCDESSLGETTVKKARDGVKQVAHGVQYLHFREILHNNIKTDNVLLRRGSDQRLTAKVIGFGCASWTENPIGFNCGEGVSNHGGPNGRSGDVYSMGRLLEAVCRVYKLEVYPVGSVADFCIKHTAEEGIGEKIRETMMTPVEKRFMDEAKKAESFLKNRSKRGARLHPRAAVPVDPGSAPLALVIQTGSFAPVCGSLALAVRTRFHPHGSAVALPFPGNARLFPWPSWPPSAKGTMAPLVPCSHPIVQLHYQNQHRQGDGNGGQRAPEYIRVHMEVLVTLKVAAKVPMERYTAVNIERRPAFLEWRSHVDPEDVYFAEETGFNIQTDRRGEHMRGTFCRRWHEDKEDRPAKKTKKSKKSTKSKPSAGNSKESKISETTNQVKARRERGLKKAQAEATRNIMRKRTEVFEVQDMEISGPEQEMVGLGPANSDGSANANPPTNGSESADANPPTNDTDRPTPTHLPTSIVKDCLKPIETSLEAILGRLARKEKRKKASHAGTTGNLPRATSYTPHSFMGLLNDGGGTEARSQLHHQAQAQSRPDFTPPTSSVVASGLHAVYSEAHGSQSEGTPTTPTVAIPPFDTNHTKPSCVHLLQHRHPSCACILKQKRLPLEVPDGPGGIEVWPKQCFFSSGNRSGVATQLKQENGKIVSTHCIAHRCALAVGQSGNKVKYIGEDFKPNLLSLFLFYDGSAVRSEGHPPRLDVEEAHTAQGRKDVRWLSHVGATSALYRSLRSVLVHLNEEMGKGVVMARAFWTWLSQYKAIVTLYLLCDVLPHLSGLSKIFQQNRLDLTEVHKAVETKKKVIRLARGQPLEGPRLAELDEDLRPGGRLDGLDIQVSDKQREDFARLRRSFIDHLLENLDERFPQTELLSAFGVLGPGSRPVEMPRDYGWDEIDRLATFYADGHSPIDREALRDEWIAFRQHLGSYRGKTQLYYWWLIFGTFVGGIGLVAVKQLARRTKATNLSLLQEADILASVCHNQWFPFIYGINPDVPQPYPVQEFVSCTEGSMRSVSFHYLLNCDRSSLG
ncbi:EDIL3 [Branchiostoma lanceolatum]|uniref:EDIL3 protein n=1 Tax=Branchiostoma lanceolatum TaxID=7740 RepID=A0A8J9YQ31_BRALA|nr:EDIL3 [Branchiostoma lanceolatum]